MGFLKKHGWWILLLLFILWASQSPDEAAQFVRTVFGWLFGDFFPGLGDFLGNLT